VYTHRLLAEGRPAELIRLLPVVVWTLSGDKFELCCDADADVFNIPQLLLEQHPAILGGIGVELQRDETTHGESDETTHGEGTQVGAAAAVRLQSQHANHVYSYETLLQKLKRPGNNRDFFAYVGMVPP
jgi:hypothetical protein